MQAQTTDEQIFTAEYGEPACYIPLKISQLEKWIYVWGPESTDEYLIPLLLKMKGFNFIDGHGTQTGS